jgi:hypothetical protein
MGSSSNSPSAQTIARPDPFFAALLGPARRVGEEEKQPDPNTEFNPESLKRRALQGRESQQTAITRCIPAPPLYDPAREKQNMTEITDYIFWAFDLVWLPLAPLFESAFLSSVVGALGGAYFGARAAQELAARKQDKDELKKHIRATSYAITLATALVGFFVGTKKQQVMGITQRYKELHDSYNNFMAGKADGSIPANTQLHLQLDMSVLSTASAPVEVLRTQLVEKIQVRRSRPIRLQLAMEQSAEGLNEFIHKRNQWIENFRANPVQGNQLPAKLFGISVDGVTDMTYPACIQAIKEHCDDAVFFSHLLCCDLQAHGKELRDEYIRRYGKPAPSTTTVSFADVIAEDLIPPDSQYQSWFTGFIEAPMHQNKYQRVYDWIKEVFVPTKV